MTDEEWEENVEIETASLEKEGRPTYDELLESLVDMVHQHCWAPDDEKVFDTGALSANRDAMFLLVRAGKCKLVRGGYGRRWFCEF